MAKQGELAFLGRRWVRLLLAACVLLVAALIFAFSAQDGQTSSRTSDRVVKVVVELSYPDFDSLPVARQRSLWQQISFYVRKSAHFLEYTALGFFLHLLARSLFLRLAGLWAWLGGALYAA
ncbi:MAG: VanZ family protein, partial [Clostridia bacterium]|nr:VanZ family protein [Clostridia bacterium]